MMPEMIIYLLKANIALALFYAGYRLILQRYTFYIANRFYLLFALVYSALYPLIDISRILSRNQQLKEKVSLLTSDWQGSVTYIVSQSQDRAGNYWQFILVIFWTGVLFMSLRLLLQLLSLLVLHLKASTATLSGVRFRKISKPVNPFSFWRTIYLNPECHDPGELPSILEHEQIHVRQLHTADVMLAELSTIFYWFNPGVWLMKRAIKANLEYITDQEVIRSGIDAREYQYALLRSQALPQNSMPVNNFHFLTIKKRIAMINKKPSNRINLSNYALLLPSIMLLVLITGISKAQFSGSAPETPDQLPKITRIPFAIKNGSSADSGPSNTPVKTLTITKKRFSSRLPKPALDTNKKGKGEVREDIIRLNPNVSPKPLYVVDDKLQPDFPAELSADRIESITVTKGGGAVKKYGDNGKNGVIEITTKSSATGQTSNDLEPKTAVGYGRVRITGQTSNDLEAKTVSGYSRNENISISGIDKQLIILDGKEITKAELDQLKASSIGSVEIYKGRSAERKYGTKGEMGVIVITTKK